MREREREVEYGRGIQSKMATFLLESGGDAKLPLRTREELLCSRVPLWVVGVVLGGLSEKTGERRRGLGFLLSARVHGGLGAGGEKRGVMASPLATDSGVGTSQGSVGSGFGG
jgi:hypothetical protein